jgi:hypothetical protein
MGGSVTQGRKVGEGLGSGAVDAVRRERTFGSTSLVDEAEQPTQSREVSVVPDMTDDETGAPAGTSERSRGTGVHHGAR